MLSGFRPVLVLKNQAFSGTGKTRSAWLRKSLTVSQFVIAQVFIIATLLVSKQISYALNKDLGFKKDAIISFRVNYRQPPNKKSLLLDKLKAIPGVAMASINSNPPSSNGTWTSTLVVNDGKKRSVKTYRSSREIPIISACMASACWPAPISPKVTPSTRS
ncbi:hypothetical protein ACQ86N_18440 [Puia sp. P3]|uniref:hypothetical protein n=1 Tax=Puia sp. P3 TaxID=3423952 RepID=UPI003D673E21